MVNRIAIGAVLFLCPLWAGVRMRGELKDVKSGALTEQSFLLDTNRVRVDIKGPQGNMSMILLMAGDNPRLLMLDHGKGEYYEMDKKSMDQMSQQVSGAMAQMEQQLKNLPPEQRAMMEKMMKGKMPMSQGAPAAAPIVYTARGPSNMNGYRCTMYDGVREGQKVVEACAAEPSQLNVSPADFQGFENMKKFFDDLKKNMPNMPFASAGASVSESGPKGFPVHQKQFRSGEVVNQFDLKELQSATFTDGDFSTGNARKVEMMPGAPSRR